METSTAVLIVRYSRFISAALCHPGFGYTTALRLYYYLTTGGQILASGINHLCVYRRFDYLATSAIASCKVLAQTNEGDIRLSFTQDPGIGLSVIGRAEEGTVLLGINVDGTAPPTAQARTELRDRTKGYEGKQVQVEVTATSALSNVTILRYE